MCAMSLIIATLSKSSTDTLAQSDGTFESALCSLLARRITFSEWKMREKCWEKEMRELRDNRGITGEIRMSSLLLQCLRREPSAGEIVPQIRSEARLQCRGLQLWNSSHTNRGQSSWLNWALPPTKEDTLAKEKKIDIERYTWTHTKKHMYMLILELDIEFIGWEAMRQWAKSKIWKTSNKYLSVQTS